MTSLIFGGGSRMSRELFREVLSAEGPSAVSAFQAFMHTSVALGERRAGVVSTMSLAAHLGPVELLGAYPTRRCDAVSLLKDLLPHARCPHAAGRRRGGDGEWATCPTTGDDLENSGGAVGLGEGGAAGARISPVRRAPLDSATASPRWRPLRAAHRLPVEGGAGGLRLRVYRASALPALGRHGRVGSDVAAAARIL